MRGPIALLVMAALLGPAGSAVPEGQVVRPLLVTVDDLPIAGRHESSEERLRITRGLLAALERHRIRAVGLVTWRNVRDASDRDLLELWLEQGHELGNHSHDHLSYTATTSEAFLADVERARTALEAFLVSRGRQLRFFRFPFLREGDTLDKLVAAREYLAASAQRNLPVTIVNQDWSFEAPFVEARRAADRQALERVARDYHAALRVSVRHHERTSDRLFEREVPQVLLLHANEIGSAEWSRLFDWLEQTGHRFATADEVLADPAFESPPAVVFTHALGLWDRLAQHRRAEQAGAEVRELLERQAAAWNEGDLEAFCAVYDEHALFVAPSGLTRGRVAVLERYRDRYPSREAMGMLSLEVVELEPVWGLEVSMLGDARPGRVQAVSLVARWKLSYTGRPDALGLTLLVLRPAGEGWKITRDASM